MRLQPSSPPAATVRVLLATVLTAVFSTSSVVFVEPAPFDILIVLLFAIALCAGLPISVRGLTMAEVSMGAFICANIASLILSPRLDIWRAILFFGITIYLCILFQVTATLIGRFGPVALAAILKGYIASAIFAATLACLAIYNLVPFADILVEYGRAKALFKDPNVFAPFLGMPFIYLLAKLQATPSFGAKSIFSMLLLLLGTANLLSFSRSAIGVLAISTAIYLALRMLQQGLCADSVRRLLLMIILLGSAALAMWGVIGGGARALLTSRLGLQHYDADRFYVQELAIYKAARRPAGYGPGQAEVYFPSVSHLGTRAVHSTFIRAAFENGWIGVSAIVVFVSCTLYVSLRAALLDWPLAPPSAIVFASLAGTIANSFVVDTLHWRHFWLQAGMAWGVYAFGRRSGFCGAKGSRPRAVDKDRCEGPVIYSSDEGRRADRPTPS